MPVINYNLGMTYHYTTREYEVAAHYLRRSLECSQGGHGIDRITYPYLVRTRMAQNDWEAALVVNEEGRARFPEHTELLLQAGEIYERLGRTVEARWALERLVLGYDEPQYRCSEIGLRTYRGRTELALLLRRLGHLEHCEQMLREITQTYPFFHLAKVELAQTLRDLNRSEEAETLLAEEEAGGPQRAARGSEKGLATEHTEITKSVPSVATIPSSPPAATPGSPPALSMTQRMGRRRVGLEPGTARSAKRLRVAHLVPFMNIGGTERVIFDLCLHGAEEQKVVAPVDGAMRPIFEQHGIQVQIGEDRERLVQYLADADVVNIHCLTYLPNLFQAVLEAERPMLCTLHWASVLPEMPGPVICVAQHVYNLQEANHDRRLLIPNGIDTNRFRPVEPQNRGPEDAERPRILRVCRPDKCAEYFWPAVYRVLERCPRTEVIVAGGASYETGRVRSLGQQPDVAPLLAGAEIFAYTPRPWEGAMDLVVLEAMATGLPCVLSDVACVNEVVEHEVTGLLTPFEDVEAFAAALERLVLDPELRQRMGHRAAEAVRERFEIRDRMPLYSQAYRYALELHAGG